MMTLLKREIQKEAADIAFEHFAYSFWEVNKEHEDEKSKVLA